MSGAGPGNSSVGLSFSLISSPGQTSSGQGQGQGQHHTLGQIAAKFQENARAARSKGIVEDDESDGEAGEGDEDDDGGADQDDQDQSTGRWTKLEHELFLAGLKRFGKVSRSYPFSVILINIPPRISRFRPFFRDFCMFLHLIFDLLYFTAQLSIFFHFRSGKKWRVW